MMVNIKLLKEENSINHSHYLVDVLLLTGSALSIISLNKFILDFHRDSTHHSPLCLMLKTDCCVTFTIYIVFIFDIFLLYIVNVTCFFFFFN